MKSIDLNSDVGESFGAWTLGDDAAVMDFISSANVACGFHAGDPTGIRETCRAAVQHSVVIGAHPSYRDLSGFGRRFMDVAPTGLTDDIVFQIGSLKAIAHAEGASVRYVKPHGALYNAIVHHERQAQAVVEAIIAVDSSLPLVVPPGSAIRRRAEKAGLRTVIEAFADRAYGADGSLVPRSESGAVIQDPAAVVARVLALVEDGYIPAVDGTRVSLDAETLCVHGDTRGAVELSRAIRDVLREAGVETRSFVGS